MNCSRLIPWLLVWTGVAFAQSAPHVAYIYPAGGRVGTSFQATIGGQALGSISNALFVGEGLQATVMELSRPTNPKEFNTLRDRLKELQEKLQQSRKTNPTNTWTTADAAELEQLRLRLLKNPPNRQANPAMVDRVTVQITLATNTAPGEYEVRVSGANGLSNPLKFIVGTLPEMSKPAERMTDPALERFLARLAGRPPVTGTPKYEKRVSLPAVINGQIMPGGVDRYRFAARQGQQIVLAASARQLIPFLADAVPGWFEMVITLLDSSGKQLRTQERFRLHPDPVLCFNVPKDGDYILEIHDSIFRGREDFVYRLIVGEEPYVTSLFPLGCKVGEKSTLTLSGWNLPEKSLTVEPAAQPGLTKVTGPFLNTVPFAYDELPECLEQNSNHSTETAQAVTLPIIVNGHISKPGEHAYFKFRGRSGQRIVAEVWARRLDSPLDSFLRLSDPHGKQVAFNDDFEDKGSGLNTHHADSYLSAELQEDGTYFLELGDTQSQGGPEFSYRLRLSEPQPDFALRMAPSSLSVRAGANVPLTVVALRRDGFTNAINLSLATAPSGFSLSGAKIPAGKDKVQFTLKAPPQPLESPVALTISGQSKVNGKAVSHEAVPSEDMQQAFAYRHLVPAKAFLVQVIGAPKPFARDAFKILSAVPVKISRGGSVTVKLSTPSNAFLERFQLELENPMEGISLEKVTPLDNGIELVFHCDATNSGTTGNLICSILPRNPATPKKSRTVGSLPAIPVEITND